MVRGDYSSTITKGCTSKGVVSNIITVNKSSFMQHFLSDISNREAWLKELVQKNLDQRNILNKRNVISKKITRLSCCQNQLLHSNIKLIFVVDLYLNIFQKLSIHRQFNKRVNFSSATGDFQ